MSESRVRASREPAPAAARLCKDLTNGLKGFASVEMA